MTTADKIRELIAEKGLSQRKFAEMVDIHYITLGNNLKNDNFSHKSIEKIADALHLSVYDMLADEAQGKATFSNIEGYIEYNGKIYKGNSSSHGDVIANIDGDKVRGGNSSSYGDTKFNIDGMLTKEEFVQSGLL